MKFLSFLFIIMLISCSTVKQTSSSSPFANGAFDLEGHRGCRGLMPENTIPAFLKAIDIGVTTLEMDAAITKDNQVVISHDPYFNHYITTKPDESFVSAEEEKSLKIYGMTYNEVKKYDVGMKPYAAFPEQQKIPAVKPLLSDVIDSAEAYATKHSKHKIYYNIETKCSPSGDDIYHPKPALFVDLLMKVIYDKGIADRAIIQSFDIRSLQYLHQKDNTIKTSLLIDRSDKRTLEQQLKDLGFVPTIYSPEQSLVTETLIKQCHDAGMKIVPWTINDSQKMQALKQMGVDGLITDYPDRFAGKK